MNSSSKLPSPPSGLSVPVEKVHLKRDWAYAPYYWIEMFWYPSNEKYMMKRSWSFRKTAPDGSTEKVEGEIWNGPMLKNEAKIFFKNQIKMKRAGGASVSQRMFAPQSPFAQNFPWKVGSTTKSKDKSPAVLKKKPGVSWL